VHDIPLAAGDDREDSSVSSKLKKAVCAPE